MDGVRKQAEEIQNKLHNYLDRPDDPQGQALKQSIQKMIDNIRMQKNKYTIEDGVKAVIRVLDSIKDYEVIDYEDIDDLKDRCEDMRRAIQKL